MLVETIEIGIKNIKNIMEAQIELPLESGVYCLVGNNGCGKSTLLLIASLLTSKYGLNILESEDYSTNSFITFGFKSQIDKWEYVNGRWIVDTYPHNLRFNGMYEGSLFYGTRFDDSRVVDNLIRSSAILESEIVDSDDYIIKKMSFILHGNYSYYQGLQRIRNRNIAKRHKLTNVPYFLSVNGNPISQYRMSSGECLLISLLHFVYNSIIRRSLPQNEKILVLIDEIELALHPIAVSRLLDLLNELHKDNGNLVVILTSHSPEVIRKIPPNNIYLIQNDSGVVNLINPCFPSYVIRDVYKHDGFDHLLLVEDELAVQIVNRILLKNNLRNSKLIHVIPVGGWKNVLQLHADLMQNNVLGVGKEITSILDGDIKSCVGDDFKSIRKLYLPIKSVEKFLYNTIFENKNPALKKIINDKYFPIESLDDLVEKHNQKYKTKPSQADKKFYFRLKKNLEHRRISEEHFIQNLCDDIFNTINFNKFESSLNTILSNLKVC